ncbi:GNAT family N-acetyltransferase [Pseudoalteromonas sp. BZB3]|uniref:GNAT family N-acetyltransferase n=1 Tax=Pseudoalteromonas sp. BZB3 TaxID=3136670 RepID=UPI0032C4B1A8|tara:strand:+ start:1746 stop:2195 length:450 start_codon:yes stop_codon:yes gene_type:complete
MKKDDIKLVNTVPEQLAILEGWEQQAGVGEFILANSKEQHLVSMQEPTIQYLSVLQNERLVGFIILALEPNNTIEFRRIVIGHRGAGIGQLAIRAMEQYCLEHFACQRIWLDVFDFNERGQHIYSKLGYQEFKRCQHGVHQLLFFEKYF